jgi:hypothetical protein
MEKRDEVRTALNEPVIVTEVDPPGQPPTGGVLKNISGSGMQVRLPHGIARRSMVKIETKDMLMLGEVVRCEPDGDGFKVALALRHSLQSLAGLATLNRALMNEELNEDPNALEEGAVTEEVRVRTRP